MNGYRRSRRLIRLAQLLTITSTALAVSLQDFQAITIIQVPSLSCLGAYGSTIIGCSRSDFQEGVQCSDSCARGILQDERHVISACRNIEVNGRSLLGLALQGGLLDALCPDFQVTSVTSTVVPITTRTFLTPSRTQEPSTSTTSTVETSSTLSTVSSESSTTVQATASETDTTVISPTITEAETTTTIPSTSTQSPTQTADGQDDQGNQDDGDDGDGRPFRGSSGGGSPFDPVIVGGAERILQGGAGILATLMASLITTLILG